MVDEYLDEREQAEQLKQWFKENWLWMVAGIGLGLGGLYGWQGYNAYLDGKSQDAGQRFTAMLQAFDSADLDKGREIGAEIISKYGSTPYADQAVMVIARGDAETDQLDDAAAKHQQWRNHPRQKVAEHQRCRQDDDQLVEERTTRNTRNHRQLAIRCEATDVARRYCRVVDDDTGSLCPGLASGSTDVIDGGGSHLGDGGNIVQQSRKPGSHQKHSLVKGARMI